MAIYAQAFSKLGVTVAQVLLTQAPATQVCPAAQRIIATDESL